jgi:hypothetical protein
MKISLSTRRAKRDPGQLPIDGLVSPRRQSSLVAIGASRAAAAAADDDDDDDDDVPTYVNQLDFT